MALALLFALLGLAPLARQEPPPDAKSLARALARLDDETADVARAAADAVVAMVRSDPELAEDRTLYAKLRAAANHALAASLLGRIATPRACELLVEMVGSHDLEQRLAGLDGFLEMEAPHDLDAVRPLLRASNETALRKKACLVVGRLHDADAVPPLIELLLEDDPGLVANAWWALQETTGQSLARDPDLWTDWWERGGKEAVERREAAAAAGATGSANAPPPAPAAPPSHAAPASESPAPAATAKVGGTSFVAIALTLAAAAIAVVVRHRRRAGSEVF